jgi:REP element-mobilizing transposase RayT
MSLPNRKHTRLKYYDYSQPGFYYVTIHTEQGSCNLSHITPNTGRIQLTRAGKIAQKQLFLLTKRYPTIRIDKYVIMPTHIHAIIQFVGKENPVSLMDAVRVFKSLTTREYNQIAQTPGARLFQVSFYDTVLRNEAAYQACWKYIDENPLKWALDPEDR